MSPLIPFRRRSTVLMAVWTIAAAVLAFASIAVFLDWRSKPSTHQGSTVTLIRPGDKGPPTTVTIIRPDKTSRSEAPAIGSIEVIDGDTVRSNGVAYRLIGYDTPERGDKARCDDERRRAELATNRLRALVGSGNAQLTRVACSCPPEQEGTRGCNYGRLCGSLTVAGRDVGQILVSEGLAHLYVCAATSCPKRRPWC
jgi:endonuclease YncB( thermonuclease family)